MTEPLPPSCPTCGAVMTARPMWSGWADPQPKTRTVSLPVSSFGVTVVIMDSDGNMKVRVDQPTPDNWLKD